MYESRWNVADMQGNLFPDDVVEGVTQGGNTDPHMRLIDLMLDLSGEGGVMVKGPNEIEATLRKYINRATDIMIEMDMEERIKERMAQTKWDLCDDDGDHHSPSWYIAALHSTGDAYMALHRQDIDTMTPEQEAHHMKMLDDALEEMEMYEKYVDKLFGYTEKGQ